MHAPRTTLQVLHSGAGRKRRRIGRTRRLLMRGVLCGLLLCWKRSALGRLDQVRIPWPRMHRAALGSGQHRALLSRGIPIRWTRPQHKGLLMLLTWLWTEVGTFDGWSITSFFALMTALVTLQAATSSDLPHLAASPRISTDLVTRQAAIELWGRGFSLAPDARDGISATSPEIGLEVSPAASPNVRASRPYEPPLADLRLALEPPAVAPAAEQPL